MAKNPGPRLIDNVTVILDDDNEAQPDVARWRACRTRITPVL
jgi:hypothetical protein